MQNKSPLRMMKREETSLVSGRRHREEHFYVEILNGTDSMKRNRI
jgi:hypothetical protein